MRLKPHPFERGVVRRRELEPHPFGKEGLRQIQSQTMTAAAAALASHLTSHDFDAPTFSLSLYPRPFSDI